MKTTTILSLCLILPFAVSAQVTGPASGAQYSEMSFGGQTSWSSTGNVASSDNSYTYTGNIPGGPGAYSEYLVITDFGFDLPDGVIVRGVQVDVERSDPSGLSSDYSIRLIKDGVLSTENKSTGAAYPTSDAYITYGGSEDLWGDEISYKDVDNSSFGVAISAQRNAAGGTTAGQIDHVTITVYWSHITLPVVFQSFQLQKETAAVKVSWNTSAESEIESYEVQRSTDASLYQTIKTVAAKNTASNHYSARDDRPLPGLSYYRIRIKEQSGIVKYSYVLSAFMATTADLRLAPSPWKKGTELYVANPDNKKINVIFYNAQGETIGRASTERRQVPTDHLNATRGIVYYKVFDAENRMLGSGNLLVQ
jgi:hypothetical protein